MLSASFIYKCSGIRWTFVAKTGGLHVKIIFFGCFLHLVRLTHYRKNSALTKFNAIEVLITSLSVFLDLQKYKSSTVSMWLWVVFVIQVWFVWTFLRAYSWKLTHEEIFTMSSVSGIFQIWWDSGVL